MPYGQNRDRNSSVQQVSSASAANTDRVSPTAGYNGYIGKNLDYTADGSQSDQNMLQMQSIATPSVQTVVPHEAPSNMPMTFGRPQMKREESESLMQLNRLS